MNCRHEACRQPISRCQRREHTCAGWIHTRTGMHACGADWASPHRAGPAGTPPPVTETPTGKPAQEVA